MRSTGFFWWTRVQLFVLALMIAPFVHYSAATDDDKEKELIRQAEDLFKEELYVNAMPLYSQLLSLYPDDANYNFKFSVCMLYAEEDKGKAISYLEKATANLNSDKKSFYYLGYAYQLNYQFKKAIAAYNRFKSGASKKELETLQVDRRIEMCENGLTLLHNQAELSVLNKTEIKESEYFRTYDMELLTGKILVKPNAFKTANDIERKEESLVYLGKDAKMLFYSGYGKDGDNRDLYMVLKKPNGEWGTAERLPDYINSKYDENFPVMHPNRNVLYFSSKGHNSMGGYDIFKAKYDSTSNEWSKPVNMDFPINSADDDILYLPTADERTAFFSSKRASIQGNISVYKIKLKEAPGRFTPQGEPEIASVDKSAEPPPLEEVLAASALEVNAREEDFAEKNEIKTPAEKPPSESIKAETFTNMSTDEMVSVGYEYADNIRKDQVRLQNEAEASFEIARQKKEESTAKAKEAESIRTRLGNIDDAGQKEIAVQKAVILEEESAKLAGQADLAFGIAKSLTSEADVRKKQAATASENAEKIKTAAQNGRKDESITVLIDQKVLAQSIESSPAGVSQEAAEKEMQAKAKEADAGEAYEKIQFMESEIIEIDADISTLMEQAERTKDPVIKEELLAQAQELEAEKMDTEADLAATYIEAKSLDTEAKTLRREADVQGEVFEEILASSQNAQAGSKVGTAASSSSPEKPESVSASKKPESGNEPAKKEKTTAATVEYPAEENAPTTEEPLVSIVPDRMNESESTTSNTTTSGVRPTEERPAAESNAVGTEDKAGVETASGNENETTSKSATAGTASEVVAENTKVSETIPEEYFDINAESVEEAITEETVVEEMLAVEKLENEAQKYDLEAKNIREKAENADPAFKEAALQEANKYEEAAAKKRADASSGKSLINSYTFKASVKQYNSLTSNQRYLNSQDLAQVREEQKTTAGNFEKAQEIRTAAETIEDPKDKAKALHEAEQLEIEAIASQEAVNNRLSYKENQGEIADRNKSIGRMDSEEVLEISKVNEESENLYTLAKGLRENAKMMDDPVEKEETYKKADALEQQAIEKQQTALHMHELYKYEGILFEAVKTARPMEPGEKESLDALELEYNELVNETKSIRSGAEHLNDPVQVASELKKANALEEQAIEKQRDALIIYFESDESVAQLLGEEPAPVTASATGSNQAQPLPERSEPSVTLVAEPTPDETGEPSTASANKTGSNQITANTSKTGAENEMRTAPKVTPAPADNRTAGELVADSEVKREEAKRLYERIETIEDPEEMMAALEKAEKLEVQADAEMARAKQLEPDNSAVVAEQSTSTGQPNTGSAPSGYVPENKVTEAASEPAKSTSTASTENLSKVTVGGTPIEEASPEDIIAAIMNDEVIETTSTKTGTSTTSGQEDIFYIDKSGQSDIQYSEEGGGSSSSGSSSGSGSSGSSSVWDDGSGSGSGASSEKTSSADRYGSSGSSDSFEPVNTGSDEAVTFLNVDKPLEADIFTVNDMVPYTPANPIPVNPVIPSGLLFKVQVGAFRNPIPQDLFKGINPIMGEKTNKGFIRYSAGLFRKLSSANEAKEVIRGMGYSDAFVVAFYNGARVSIADARKMLADGAVPQPIAARTTTGTSGSAASSGTPGYETTSGSAAQGAIPGTTDISAIAELFYTVQVGVYSKPTNVGARYGLDDLYTVRTSNGYIRYNHGKFNSFSDADNRKETVVDKGIKDAFVTAYYNGERITVAQARNLPQPSAQVTTSGGAGQVAPGEESDFSVDLPQAAGDARYLVKIGEFGKDVPVDEATTFLAIKDLGIEVHESDDKAIYTVGDFLRYEEAEELRVTVESRGIAKPDVVVLREGRIITVEEYLKSTLEQGDE